MTDLLLEKGFNYFQIEEITQCILQGLDYTYLLNPRLLTEQMKQIRLGLMEGLDVSVYNKEEFDSCQMSQIRQGLKDDLDVSCYANTKYSSIEMSNIRLSLKNGLDISKFLDKTTDISKLLILSELKCLNFDINNLIDKKKSYLINLKDNFLNNKISIYAKKNGFKLEDFNFQQIEELKYGLLKGFDISICVNPKYKWNKIREIISFYEKLDNELFVS